MKKRMFLFICAIIACVLLGCGSKDGTDIGPGLAESEKDTDTLPSDIEKETDDIKESEDEKESEGGKESEGEFTRRTLECDKEDFESAADYIKKHREEVLYLNYQESNYAVGEREEPLRFEGDIKAVDAKLSADYKKTLRFLREDNEGSVMDVTVYIDENHKLIDKLITCEYCADGRELTEYYFEEGQLIYAYAYQNDVYGLAADGLLPGKRCYFSKDVLVECVLNDQDVDYKNVSYALKDYDVMDEFTKTQYDQLEKDMINSAYTCYEAVRKVPGFAKIYGYVGDEFGGMLSNVHITLKSIAHNYSVDFDTNGDGYFEVLVPVNLEDDYGIVCKYGEFTDSTVDDIHIKPGTVEYSLGRIYMAEPGNAVHEPNTYLLNANYTSPKPLSKGEYCITFSYEDTSADLKPFGINLNSGKSNSDSMLVIKPKAEEHYKYYVTDQRGGKSGNPMTYEMTSSNAVVRVYGETGLVASYQAPVGRAGTVWEVFEFVNGEIVPINNCFYKDVSAPFFTK